MPGDVEALVLAACEDRLGDVVDDLGAVERRVLAPGGVADPAGAYLGAITVQGFRGIGEQRRLDLVPGPGLTIVLGRNGSGKSSFARQRNWS